ncbi:DNA replication complex GINS protein PSF3 [Anopheles arabiensis]|uniref:DNA replication complex GINS protein PSF3 n=3 Tax=gambiae species complex TaxID=44542 RepID=Q7QHC9_ANOGA|nr:DNA replication complex GINS protein PSF3 [Anopheles arabiensis]XP_041781646.1 DNA replication complex GINS protein PSF3 [Anopheles merus]XP_041781649.1 DNA replication complex GINS protein PSF3 [Anopheles merus]EAA05294.4 AGAP011132-PA [Anopheles gambiae str. PEST]
MNIPSFRPNYYSLDDIAITQERIPCRTTQDLHMMGFLDASEKSPNLSNNHTLELPLWVMLTQDDRNPHFEALVPDIYSAAYKEIYQADANYVELGALCKFYFELGMYLTRYQNNNSVAEMLYTTAQERLKGLKDLCQNVGNDSLNVASKFDFSERLLFNEGTKTNKLFDDWLQERQVHIKSTEIAINIRKRKRSPDGETQEEQQ